MGGERGRGAAGGTAAEGAGAGTAGTGTTGAGTEDASGGADDAAGQTCGAENEELVVTGCCTVGEASMVVGGRGARV